MSSKSRAVRVITTESELEFDIQPSTTGKQLFDHVVTAIGLREVWFFGLQYTDSKGYLAWLHLNKNVFAHDFKEHVILQLRFLVKFYPEDLPQVIQDVTLRLLYLQVREQILSDQIYAPPESTVILASFSTQVKFGDCWDDDYKPGCLVLDRLLPKRVISQYRLSSDDWEKRIISAWKDHRGMSREASMTAYLKVAQDLDMYGVTYFEIHNKKGTELYLGVNALGLFVYDRRDKLSPKIGFPWHEIRSIAYHKKRFTVKPIDKNSEDFQFYAPLHRINKRILELCMGNHELYIRRRYPDSPEIQQLKQQVKDERMLRQLEQERLNKEIEAREAAEAKQRECEEQLVQMQEDMDLKDHEITRSHQQITELERQLVELSKAKEELQHNEEELMKLNEQLRSEQAMSQEERSRLIDEIAHRKKQVDEMRSLVELRTHSTTQLQRVVSDRYIDRHHVPAQQQHTDFEGHDSSLSVIPESSPMHRPASRQRELDQLASKRSTKIREKLEALSGELESAKINDFVSDYDLLHNENKRAGHDKYKNIQAIRSGNTKRRVDQFENL